MTAKRDKPRLLIVLPATSFGGAERVVFNLIKGITEYDCSLLTQKGISEAFRPLDARVYYFDDFGCESPYDMTPMNSLRYAFCVWRVARMEQPDRIKAMMHNGTFFCSLARQLPGLRIPLLGSIHGNISAYFQAEGRPPTWWERLIIRMAVTIPYGLVTPSRGVAEDLILHYSARKSRIKAIPNGIELERIENLVNEPIEGLQKDGQWIVTACRLASQKDFMTLLKAFDIVRRSKPSVKLVIVGEGESRERVETKIKELDLLDRVVMVGFQENPYRFLAKAEISVLSSFYEGSPVAIIEAFAMGLPQVVTDCPSGPSELIQDGINGFLVPIGDAEAMADRMLRLLDDEALRQFMSHAARQHAQHFGLQDMVHQYEHYLQSLGNERMIQG